jgi:hypothetical protein
VSFLYGDEGYLLCIEKGIIDQATEELSKLLTTMIHLSSLSDCEIHLWGGIFKNAYAESFIQKIKEKLPEAYRNLKIT